MIEDDAICMYPNILFGDDILDWMEKYNIRDVDVDCRASSYVRKGPVFPVIKKFD